jgi:hypothetical protein
MRKSQLRQSHNNLLSLISNIEELKGLLLIYATTPDFFTDDKHGIKIYGALAGRIGELKHEKPKSRNVIWNLDALDFSLENYQNAAIQIRDLYLEANKGLTKEDLGSDESLENFVNELYDEYSTTATVRFWRILCKALIEKYFDEISEGTDPQVINAQDTYYSSLDDLKEE